MMAEVPAPIQTDLASEVTLLGHRCVEAELMDEPDMAGERHAQALRGLERINAWSGSARILWPALARLAREERKQIGVLDVATGAGDLPIRLWQRARRAGLKMKFHGIDRSVSAVEYARRRALERESQIRFCTWDALSGGLPGEYDAITCSLFLHHLEDERAVDLLRRMAMAARRLVLVNDLERSAAGLVLAYVGSRVLSRSPVVHVDGVRSVRAAFTAAEVAALARRAGLEGATVSRWWPCRYLLTWSRA
jgi:2-polyprenyl-3-methyl-5-hydroxy-6-metoxy-1,4-benzoquinol methylase